jgi:serine phosphatase RsbU (regulator of sigma subunit)
MIRQNHLIRTGMLIVAILVIHQSIYCQREFDNPTRALYIFDLSKYIGYGPGFADSSNFRIGVLLGDYDLIYELGNLAKTRKTIQQKPVVIVGFKNIESITHTQVLYLSKNSGHDLDLVKSRIAGHQTMLITEGYEFRESMINFIVVKGKPQYDINEEMVKDAGMSVPQEVLFMAVKTKEDWENLFGIASREIEVQKETIMDQIDTINYQRQEILNQKILLDSLDNAIIVKEKMLGEKQKVLGHQSAQIKRQLEEISIQKKIISDQQKEVQVQKDTLENQKAKIKDQLLRINDQVSLISEQEKKITLQLEAIEKQKIILWSALVALLLVSILGYFIYRSYIIKKEANAELEEKNRTISMQRDEIAQQRDLASAQRDQIAYQKKHITDSIGYAQRIQAALMPSLELFSDRMEHFVLYKPLAIVSGDFYWTSTQGNKQVIISADCTGHGVPGAFMSMLGVTLLNEIVNGKHILMPDEIIDNLRQGVIKSLNQYEDDGSVKDGMDISVCTVDFDQNILWYAGANSPLYLVRGSELRHYRADKMPASIHHKMQPFTLHRIELRKGDAFYIFSDGYADQFGGRLKRKFMSPQLKETLMSIAGMPMLQQGEKLNEIFENWKGSNPQVDDVTVIGVRY